MRYLRQFMLILAFSFFGEMLSVVLPFPIPAGIYGLVFLFFALETGVIRLEAVKDAAGWLLEIMPVLFIPAGVGLLSSWDILKPVLFPVLVIMLVSTIAVMAVSGRVTQSAVRRKERKVFGKGGIRKK